MHEITLCKTMLEMVLHHLTGKKSLLVKKICLEVGLLTCIDVPALRFGFEVVCQGTAAEHAVLEIVTVSGQAQCTKCNLLIEIENYYDPCPSCGQMPLTVIKGDELRLKSMEVA